MANIVQDPREEIEALRALLAERDARITGLIDEVAKLEHKVEVYSRLAYGKSSERRPVADQLPDNRQGHLFATALLAEATEAAERAGESGAIETKGRSAPKKKSGRRQTYPDHLPQVKTTYALDDKDLHCSCGGDLHHIGWESTKELERVEICIVHTIQRGKYACRKCSDGVVTAKGPTRVIEKGILGPHFLGHVAVEHLITHLPYHRLEKKYASEGVRLSRSVLERSMAKCAELLEPIQGQMLEELLASPAIHTDDTPVTIARGGPHGSRQGRIWIYRDLKDRHVYDFTESRCADRTQEILKEYKGYIHADAYPGYDTLFGPGGATEVACWAHVRRKFLDAEKTEPDLAKGAVERIARLYAIETAARERELEPKARAELRKAEATPLLEELHAYLSAAETQVLAKSPMATAIRYALNLWPALTVYLTNGLLNIDNNPAENAIRPVAVGRKNWLFVQNVAGGRRLCTLQSLLFTAKAIGINPARYLADVLVRIAHETDEKKLTPHGWKEHFQAEVDERMQGAEKRLLGL